MNLCRYLRYKWLKLTRIADSNCRIAGGLATGMAISFSPLVGLHMLQATGLSYIFRFNILAALTGTVFGNPWTFPFIWWASAEFGSYLFDIFGFPSSVQLPETITLKILWDLVKNEPLKIFLPWFVGGHIFAFVSWFIFYYINLHFVRTARAARRKAIKLKHKRKTKPL